MTCVAFVVMLTLGEHVARGHRRMFDQVVSLAVQHYVIVGILALAVGVVLNFLVAAAPEIVQSLRLHKLY